MKTKKRMKIGIIILSILQLYFSYVMVEQQKILGNKAGELNEVKQQISEEKKLNSKLDEQLKTVNSDEYLEKVARQKLGLVKEGERVFVDVSK